MSSSTSSSSHSQRTPLQERNSSERNKQQIRLVPYTPPKLEADEASALDPETTERNVSLYSAKGRGVSPSPQFGREKFIGSAFSSTSPSSSPIIASTWVKGKGVSESSGSEQPTPPPRALLRASHGRHGYVTSQQPQSRRESGTASSAPLTRPLSRRDRSINIHSDKTFSLVQPANSRVSAGSESTAKSYRHSSTSFFSSHGETSFDAPTDDHPSSLFSSFPERSVSPASPDTATSTPKFKEEDHVATSPWNYRMIGGVRKVPKTPDAKTKGKEKEAITEPVPILQETTAAARLPGVSSPLTLKTSFTTEHSDSISGDTTNYKIIGRSSPPMPDSDSIDVSPLSDSSNYQVFGQSPAPQSFPPSPTREQSILETPGSKNYIVHPSRYPASEQVVLESPGSRNFIVYDNVSISSSAYPVRGPRSQTSCDSFGQPIRQQYSQESLVIPPLRPHKRSSSENLYLKRGSRETLHGRSNSYSSISSVLTQDTGPNVIILGSTPSAQSSPRQNLLAGRRGGGSLKDRMDVHQWSSQLSTVMSEYEGSDRGSRMTSLGSLIALGSRNIQSISSSIFDNLDPTQAAFQTHSRSGSFDQLGATPIRDARELPNPPAPTVRHHDEHGDGLADLQEMHQLQSKSSRTRLGFLSRHSSDRSLRSTSSSRAGSFTANSLPTWARLYYGSGERRWLASSSVISEADDCPPPSSWVPDGSPAPEQFSHDISNPRRRPRDVQQIGVQTLSPEIPAVEIGEIRQGPKKKTSSIWSPHLRPDRWASRYSVWQPPSVAWSAESRVFGRRNIQVVLFVMGFIIPFAWMIAALLPLPPKPHFEMQEQYDSTTQFQIPEDSVPEAFYQRVAPVDDSRYQSARWWRNLNRYMSIIGLLILGAIVALIVVGVHQGWGK
ncbi:hypothetical protein F4777DRAFT_589369 [Nemania sp. FL0916]|nr:hypothetical protein F4777DRAFT_589369 [Nemania sp. FL0916]